MENPLDNPNTRNQFYEDVFKRPQKSSHFQMSTEKYNDLVQQVKTAKNAVKRETGDYWLLKQYDVIKTDNGRDQLISPAVSGQYLYYATSEQVFDILLETHLSLGHGSADKMRKVLQGKYKNLTVFEIHTFLNLCEPCAKKRKNEKKGLENKAMIMNQIKSRGQLNVIDYQKQPDGCYNFIMVYQDHLTKFVVLKPLKTNRPEEIAVLLRDLFLLFGAPAILQSDNGRQFVSEVLEKLKLLWTDLKIVLGKLPQPNDLNQTIEKLLTTWMRDNKTTNWCRGLGFVQFIRNQAIHSAINRSPFGAMFGQPAKMGLTTSIINKNIVHNLNTEEDLERLVQQEDEQLLQPEVVVEVEDQEKDSSSIPRVSSNARSSNTNCSLCRQKLETIGKEICARCYEQMALLQAKSDEKKKRTPSKRGRKAT